MRRTASLFATMTKDSTADRAWADAANAKAQTYEEAFAKAAVTEPPLQADTGDAQQALLQAARLRSLVATGDRLVNPDAPPRPVPTYAETVVMYRVASLTARDDDPHINDEFFRNGSLLPPNEIPEEDLSIYRAQLRVYLVPWPQINAAIDQFASTYSLIADGQ